MKKLSKFSSEGSTSFRSIFVMKACSKIKKDKHDSWYNIQKTHHSYFLLTANQSTALCRLSFKLLVKSHKSMAFHVVYLGRLKLCERKVLVFFCCCCFCFCFVFFVFSLVQLVTRGVPHKGPVMRSSGGFRCCCCWKPNKLVNQQSTFWWL